MGVTIGGDAVKSGKNTHLLVIMPAGILQKIGLTDLMNRNIFSVGRGPQIYKHWTINGGDNWG